MGFVAMNPKALPLVSPEFRKSADPRNLENAIPQTEPDNADVYERAWQEVQAAMNPARRASAAAAVRAAEDPARRRSTGDRSPIRGRLPGGGVWSRS